MRLALFSLLMISLTFGCSTPDEAKPTTEPLPDMDGSIDTNDADGDGVETDNDCDDTDSSVGAIANDQDCDSATTDEDCDDTDPTVGAIDTDRDCDGAPSDQDCNDNDPTFGSSTDDPDCDGATTAEEEAAGSNPLYPDTDGDWVMDGQEIHGDRDVLVPELVQITLGESDEFVVHMVGQTSDQATDVTFLLDTTCSMSSTADAMATEFVDMTVQLATVKLDIHYGFATFDDYAFGTYGSSDAGDKPFILRQSVTNDVSAVLESLADVPIHGGVDGPESSIEALYQTLTGAGYDQNCNAIFDPTTDVLPFMASEDDPFMGEAGSAQTDEMGGTGFIGGVGFRAGSRPIIVYATDNVLRDPEEGYGVPGGCPGDAGGSDVVAAVMARDATLIGISTSSWSSDSFDQMVSLARATGSIVDLDDDGTADDPLVFSWTGSSTEFSETVVAAITAAITHSEGDLTVHEEINVVAEGDDMGFVTVLEPETFLEVEVGGEPGPLFRFDLTTTGVVAETDSPQHFWAELVIKGDGGERLGGLPVEIIVPGTDGT
jgi:hypothetical protein